MAINHNTVESNPEVRRGYDPDLQYIIIGYNDKSYCYFHGDCQINIPLFCLDAGVTI